MDTEISEGHQQRGRDTEVTPGPGVTGLLPFLEPGHCPPQPVGNHPCGEEAGSESNSAGRNKQVCPGTQQRGAGEGSRQIHMQMRRVGLESSLRSH